TTVNGSLTVSQATRLSALGAGAVSSDASGNLSSGTLSVTNGGSGVSSNTAFALLAGGTTSTGAVQCLPTGTLVQLLSSGGAAPVAVLLTVADVAGPTVHFLDLGASGPTFNVSRNDNVTACRTISVLPSGIYSGGIHPVALGRGSRAADASESLTSGTLAIE